MSNRPEFTINEAATACGVSSWNPEAAPPGQNNMDWALLRDPITERRTLPGFGL